MHVIDIRKTSSRHSHVVATCIRQDDGILISAQHATYGRTRGRSERGQTDQNRHYYTRLAKPDEVRDFVAAGLIEAPPVPIGRYGHRNGQKNLRPRGLILHTA